MKPEVDFVLRAGSNTLLQQIMPVIDSNHFQGTTYLISILLEFSAQDYERGADVRVKDNNTMRALFIEAAGELGDPLIVEKLNVAAAIKETSLCISELNRVNGLLKDMFIQLHVLIEDTPDSWARDFEGRLLAHLVDGANLRKLKLPC